MNWEAIGAVGEIVGAAAVVATLFYLAAQVRSSAKQSKSAARLEIAHDSIAPALAIASDQGLAEAMAKCERDEELSQAESHRLAAFIYASNRNFESIQFQYEQDMLSADQWLGFRSNLKSLWGRTNSAIAKFWNPQMYSSAYQALIKEIRDEISRDA